MIYWTKKELPSSKNLESYRKSLPLLMVCCRILLPHQNTDIFVINDQKNVSIPTVYIAKYIYIGVKDNIAQTWMYRRVSLYILTVLRPPLLKSVELAMSVKHYVEVSTLYINSSVIAIVSCYFCIYFLNGAKLRFLMLRGEVTKSVANALTTFTGQGL